MHKLEQNILPSSVRKSSIDLRNERKIFGCQNKVVRRLVVMFLVFGIEFGVFLARELVNSTFQLHQADAVRSNLREGHSKSKTAYQHIHEEDRLGRNEREKRTINFGLLVVIVIFFDAQSE
jgi:hypothetical protein